MNQQQLDLLEAKYIDFVTKIRMGQHFTDKQMDELLDLLSECHNEFANSEVIPKRFAFIFIDAIAVIQSAALAHYYTNQEQAELYEASDKLADALYSCLS